MTRPESGDSAYLPPSEEAGGAWEFTPYRPGDKAEETGPSQSTGSWWTEPAARSDRAAPPDVAHNFREGERVRTKRGVGGVLGGAVPAGTEGHVVSVEHGLFDTRIKVEFANGYTETVSPDAIRYESGWF